MNSRENRKLAHIQYVLEMGDGPGRAGWDDIHFVNFSVPELDRHDVVTSGEWWGKHLRLPLMINAMTGGTPLSGEINRALAEVAAATGVAMAVGSQQAGLDNPEVVDSFRVARRHNPNGILLANLSARATPEEALRACEMLQADALQLHLNVGQELAMAEGDRGFSGLLNCITRILEAVQVPVVVKEVGLGLSREAAIRLYGAGAVWVDSGGHGGTNFLAIEHWRSGRICHYLQDWGIPAAASLLEVLESGAPLKVIASGGIRSALDFARALALGAEVVGVAGYFLRVLQTQSQDRLVREIFNWGEDLKDIMIMAGASNPDELRQVPLVVAGRVREWLDQRGIETAGYARRRPGLV